MDAYFFDEPEAPAALSEAVTPGETKMFNANARAVRKAAKDAARAATFPAAPVLLETEYPFKDDLSMDLHESLAAAKEADSKEIELLKRAQNAEVIAKLREPLKLGDLILSPECKLKENLFIHGAYVCEYEFASKMLANGASPYVRTLCGCNAAHLIARRQDGFCRNGVFHDDDDLRREQSSLLRNLPDQLLLERCSKGYVPAMDAVAAGNWPALEHMYERIGERIFTADIQGNTILHQVVKYDRDHMLLRIILHMRGWKYMFLRNRGGLTPLAMVTRRSKSEKRLVAYFMQRKMQ